MDIQKVRFLHITALAATLSLTCVVQAQDTTDLFSPADGAKGPASAAANTSEPDVIQSRLVTLDLVQLEPQAESVGQRVRFNLFDDAVADLELARATRPLSGGLHWFGKEAGDNIESAVLSIVEGRTSGSLTVGSRFFRIEHIAGPIHRIEELTAERESFGQDALIPPGAPKTQPLAQLLQAPPTAEMTSSHVVDILVCYTPSGKNRAGGKTQIEDRASLAVAEANSALVNSGAGSVQWNLVAAVEVSPSAPGDNSAPSEAANATYLNYLTYDMTHVHALRDTYGADIVSLWIDNAASGTIGIGWIMPDLAIQYEWYDFAPFGFNVVETHFARGPQYTFAHEVGHNLGSAHNRASAQSPGAYSYSYGFQQPDAFYTLMSYSSGCSGCAPVNAWSNPNVLINGKPSGATGSQSADNARSLTNTAPLAEAFRASVGGGPPPPPPPNGTPTANPQSVTTPYQTSKAITLSGSDPDGDPLTYSIVSQPTKGSLSGSGTNRTYTPNNGVSGSDSFQFRVSDGNGGTDDATVSITIQAPAPPPSVLVSEAVVVNGVTDQNWTSVGLSNQYGSPVIACTPAYEKTAQPAVVRMRNANSSSFEIRLSSPGAAGVTANVHCVAMEEGVYTFSQNGVKAEAVRYTSTVTDHDASWSGESRSYQNSYSNPVVIGQVMTYNGTRFSSFWARGSSGTAPPSSSVLRVGKHVGEDSTTTRNNETVGYIVMEAGAGNLGSVAYEAAVGAKSVQGMGDNPPYSYQLSSISSVQAVVASSAGMAGVNGGWPAIYGTNGASGSTLRFAIDEDVLADSERAHITERVAYVAFGTATPVGETNQDPTANAQSVSTSYQTPLNITLTASDPDEDTLSYQITTSPAHGALSGAMPTVVYTPNGGYSGPDTFTFQVNDGRGGTDSAQVSITVGSPGGTGNNAPTANPSSVTIPYEKPTWFSLTASDPDGDPLTYHLVNPPDHGGTTGTLPNILFWPESGYSGSDSLTFEVRDGKGGVDQAVVSITIQSPDGGGGGGGGTGNNAPTANPKSVTIPYEKPTWITVSASDPDGDSLTYHMVNSPNHGGVTGTLPNILFWPESGYSGSDSFTFEVRDGKGGVDQAVVSITIESPGQSSVHVENHVVTTGSSWTLINFNQPFDSPVAVCTPQYSVNAAAAVARMQNVNSNSMAVRLQTLGGSPSVTGQVRCLVVEEGVYTPSEHGVRMEAVKFTSTVTDRRNSWNGQFRGYQQAYANPVVVGQVMTSLSHNYSVFWAAGSSSTSSPTGTVLRVGKHVGEDSNTSRPNETLGYIVIDSGSGQLGNYNYVASVGPQSVSGITAGAPYTYSVSNAGANSAVLSSAGMAGNDGGFPVLLDSGVSGGVMRLGIQEDQLADQERTHAAESVAFIAIQ